jgi:hypothetical protein
LFLNPEIYYLIERTIYPVLFSRRSINSYNCSSENPSDGSALIPSSEIIQLYDTRDIGDSISEPEDSVFILKVISDIDVTSPNAVSGNTWIPSYVS